MTAEVGGAASDRRVRWSRAGGTLSRRVGGDVLVVVAGADGSNDEVKTLSGAAALVWLLLAEPASGDELVGDLGAALAEGELVGLAPEDLGPAVDEAVGVLARAGVIAPAPGSWTAGQDPGRGCFTRLS